MSSSLTGCRCFPWILLSYHDQHDCRGRRAIQTLVCEESVDLVSEMINSTALRVSPDAAVDPESSFSTPGSGLTLGIPSTLFGSDSGEISGGGNCTHDFNCSAPQGDCLNGTCVCRELWAAAKGIAASRTILLADHPPGALRGVPQLAPEGVGGRRGLRAVADPTP